PGLECDDPRPLPCAAQLVGAKPARLRPLFDDFLWDRGVGQHIEEERLGALLVLVLLWRRRSDGLIGSHLANFAPPHPGGLNYLPVMILATVGPLDPISKRRHWGVGVVFWVGEQSASGRHVLAVFVHLHFSYKKVPDPCGGDEGLRADIMVHGARTGVLGRVRDGSESHIRALSHRRPSAALAPHIRP